MSESHTAELPAGWRTARVGDILKIRNGYAFKSTDYQEDGAPLIRQSELRSDVVDTSEAKRVDPKFLTELSGFIIREGDLLIGMSGSLGKIAEYQEKEPALQNQRTGLLLLKSGYDAKFAKLVLKFVEPQIVAEGKGVAVQNVSAKEIEDCTFALPSPDEQRRIVAEIEKQFTRLEAGVVALRRVQANLNRYRAAVLKAACEGRLVPTEAELAKTGNHKAKLETGESLLTRMLAERQQNWKGRGKYKEPAAPDTANLPPLPEGWTWASAEQLCSTVASGSTPSADQLFQRDGEVPFIKVYNLTFGGPLDFSVKPTFISRIVHEGRLGRSKAFAGDVLTNIVGPPLGKVSIVPDRFPEWNINQAIVVFRPTGAIFNRLLAFWLRSEAVLARLDCTAKATAGQFNIQVTTCRKLALPVPPLAEQARIVAEVERRLSVVEELEAVVFANLQRALRLRQSILQKAFSGNF